MVLEKQKQPAPMYPTSGKQGTENKVFIRVPPKKIRGLIHLGESTLTLALALHNKDAGPSFLKKSVLHRFLRAQNMDNPVDCSEF